MTARTQGFAGRPIPLSTPRHPSTHPPVSNPGSDTPASRDAMHQSAERFARILDLLPPIAYWDTDLRNRSANAAFAQFFGVSAEAVVGRRIDEVLWPELYALSLPYFERTLRTREPQQFDRTTVDAHGVTRHAHVQLLPDLVDGKLQGVVAIATDITARREAEIALAAVEARFALLMAAPVGIATLHPNGRLMLSNPALARTLGYPLTELHGCWLSELLDDGTSPQERDRVEQLLDGRLGSASIECRLMRRDGQAITAILSVAVLAGEPGRDIAAILALQDISDRKHAEDALRASQQRLEQAEQIAQTGTFEWDLINRRVSWSSGLYRIFMLDEDDVTWGFEEGLQRHAFPADRELLREALQLAVSERSSVSLDFRVIRADGRVRTLEAHGDVVVDDAGEPVRLIAVVHDVTEQRLAQEALENASSHLADRARELQQLTAGSQARSPQGAPQEELSERQLQILRLVAQGLTNAQIAQRLFISETTVKWHVRQILAKTNASNRTEAVVHVFGGREL